MAEWAVEYQGYLSKRRRRVNGWHPRFIVLEHSVLSSFTDETRRRQTGCIRIGAGTLVQVLPQSSGALPGRGVLANAFAVFDPTDDYMLRRRREENGDDDDAASSGALLYSMIFDTSLDEPFSGATPEDSQPPLPLNSTSGDHAGSEQAPFLLAADDSHTLEMWMIALIQCINGAYRPDEGFEAGSDTQPTCWSRGRIDDDANGGWAPMAGPVLCGEGSYIANPSMYLRTRWADLHDGELRLYEPPADGSSSSFFQRSFNLSAPVLVARSALHAVLKGAAVLSGSSPSAAAGSAAPDSGCGDGDPDFCAIVTGESRDTSVVTPVDRIERERGRLWKRIPLDRGSRTVSVPFSVCGQHRCLAVVRSIAEGNYSSLRFCCADDATLAAWAAALRVPGPPVPQDGATVSADYGASMGRSLAHSIGALLSPVLHAGSAVYNGLGRRALVPRAVLDLLDGRHAAQAEAEIVYRDHFVFKCGSGGEELIAVGVFENQRYMALRGYSSDHLNPGDRCPLTSHSGQRFPYSTLAAAPPPVSYEWAAGGEAGWRVDRTHRECDDAGWAYCRSFENSVMLDSGSAAAVARQGDQVRFRRWERRARLDL